jgi:hypothetical protein
MEEQVHLNNFLTENLPPFLLRDQDRLVRLRSIMQMGSGGSFLETGFKIKIILLLMDP